jgi:transposase
VSEHEPTDEVTAEDWAATPPSVKKWFASVISRLEHTIAEQQRRIVQLEAKVAFLDEKLRTNSSNSSKPPSSDPPSAPKSDGKKSKKRRGGQPGHTRNERSLLPVDQVDTIVPCKPAHCEHCDAPLDGNDPDPLRHQVTELAPKLVSVTEYQRHTLLCSCGHATRAPLPPDAVEGFGPRMQAMHALLVGGYRLSHDAVVELMSELFGVELSVGVVNKHLQRVSEAIAPSVEQAQAAAQKEPVAYADETSWRLKHKRAWLWVMVTSAMTIFRIDVHRSAEAAKALLGSFAGVLVTDRLGSYNGICCQRQFCQAHLLRDYKKIQERGGIDGEVGERLIRSTRTVLRIHKRYRGSASAFALARKTARARGLSIDGRLFSGSSRGAIRRAERARRSSKGSMACGRSSRIRPWNRRTTRASARCGTACCCAR